MKRIAPLSDEATIRASIESPAPAATPPSPEPVAAPQPVVPNPVDLAPDPLTFRPTVQPPVQAPAQLVNQPALSLVPSESATNPGWRLIFLYVLSALMMLISVATITVTKNAITIVMCGFIIVASIGLLFRRLIARTIMIVALIIITLSSIAVCLNLQASESTGRTVTAQLNQQLSDLEASRKNYSLADSQRNIDTTANQYRQAIIKNEQQIALIQRTVMFTYVFGAIMLASLVCLFLPSIKALFN